MRAKIHTLFLNKNTLQCINNIEINTREYYFTSIYSEVTSIYGIEYLMAVIIN